MARPGINGNVAVNMVENVVVSLEKLAKVFRCLEFRTHGRELVYLSDMDKHFTDTPTLAGLSAQLLAYIQDQLKYQFAERVVEIFVCCGLTDFQGCNAAFRSKGYQ